MKKHKDTEWLAHNFIMYLEINIFNIQLILLDQVKYKTNHLQICILHL